MPFNATSWNRLRYTFYSPIYDLVLVGFSFPRRRAIKLADIKPGERVLISGCGTGLDLPHLPREIDVTAIDLTPAMVARTAARAEKLGFPVTAKVMDAERLDFPDASFDVVLMHLILAVVPDPVAAAREAARVLKPGGRISIFDKFLPDGRSPNLLRQSLNVVSHALFSDINRRLGPILDAAMLRVDIEEAVAFGDFFKVVIAVKRS